MNLNSMKVLKQKCQQILCYSQIDPIEKILEIKDENTKFSIRKIESAKY
jgi:hypothetical protein